MGMLLMVPVVVLLTLAPCAWGQTDDNWKRDVQQKVNAKEFRSAQQIVEKRIAESFLDLEAHGWRARLLAWVGQWSEAESEYRFVRQRAPNDSDILIGLSDVLFWQAKWDDALQVLDDARALQPANVEILIRRARVLSSLRETREARAQLRQVLRLDPSNLQAKAALDGIAESTIHELRFGADIETFDYTDAAETYAVSLGSRWT
ncbi:MAG TPA: tetratricopeptide repeat protein, partial [Terriglobales bacterium]|nr:tetratricopeptide repeat protein [Terriglobales bacterium]